MVLPTNFEIINRDVLLPPNIKDIVVEGDTNSKTITFNMLNRFFDGVDLSEKSIKIAYQNANSETDYDDAYLDSVDLDSFTFKWILSSGVAVKDGDVLISIEFSESNDVEEKIYIWRTKSTSFKIEPSFNVLMNATELDYTDQELFVNNDIDIITSSISDTDEPIYIEDRRILIPIIDDLVVSGDNRSQILSFQMDRFYENVDRSTKTISIAYNNADNHSDRSGIVNKVVSDTSIAFGWLIDSKVTEKDGVVGFRIEVLGYDENDKFYCWSTIPAQFTVSEGLIVDSDMPEPEPSWIQSWEIEKERFIKSLPDNFNLAESYLQSDIKGTTQRYIFDEEEQPIKIQHVLPDETVIREDIFIYSENLITEVRTLNTGETLTFIYHLDTFETEVV